MPADASVQVEFGQTVEVEVAPMKPMHGGFGEGVVHIVKGNGLGVRAKDDPTVVAQERVDVSNQTTRYVSAEPTPFYNPASGSENNAASGFDLIVTEARGGLVVVDPKAGRVSDVMTPDQYTATAKTAGIFPTEKLRHRVGAGSPFNDEIAKDAITRTIALLRGATAPTGTDPGLLNAKIAGLEASLSSIPSA